MQHVIETRHLSKRYGDFRAVDDISLSVRRGEIFGIVGPNGAGKTSTVESLIGLRWPYEGEVSVLGLHPHRQRMQLAQRIGIQLQQAQLPERLRVWEMLDLFSAFYTRSVPYVPLLETWGLADKRNTLFMNLSGGQKQRLLIALALLNDPEVVFLDELTTGLDPQARRNTWELIARVRDEGRTVVLVTHFMDEAEVLCDRIAVIDGGKLVALDTPPNLIGRLADRRSVTFETVRPYDGQALRRLPSVGDVEQAGAQITVCGHNDRLIVDVVLALEAADVGIKNLRTTQPDLEDAFIALTGRALRD